MQTLLTVKEAAAFLRLSPDTIYRATKAGTLPHVRIGRSIRLSREALEDYLENPTPRRTEDYTWSHRGPVTRL